jgi:hypothetical protein
MRPAGSTPHRHAPSISAKGILQSVQEIKTQHAWSKVKKTRHYFTQLFIWQDCEFGW